MLGSVASATMWSHCSIPGGYRARLGGHVGCRRAPPCGDSPVSVRAARNAGGVGGRSAALPLLRPASSLDPTAAEQGVQEATLPSVQRPDAPRNAVVPATSCGSCRGATRRRIHSREERSFAGRAWRQSDPNAHSGRGRARGRPTTTLGARGHTKPSVSLHRVPPRRKAGDSSGGRKPGARGETRLDSGSGALLRPSTTRVAPGLVVTRGCGVCATRVPSIRLRGLAQAGRVAPMTRRPSHRFSAPRILR